MVLVLPLFHKWKYWHHCFFMKYGILCISHTYIKTTIFHHEIWNSLYSLYQNLGTNAPSWTLDFGIVHIWRSEWRFSYKKYEITVFHMNYWFFGYWHISSLFVSLCLAHACVQLCACVTYVCVHVHGPRPLLTQRWRRKKMRCLKTSRGGRKRLQTRGDWSMHLCEPLSRTRMSKGWPVTTLDNESTDLQLPQETKTSSQFLLCSCMCFYP